MPSAIHKVEQVASLRDRIAKSLSAAIISGELAPGTLVSVPSMASQFEVSATPVREAMLDLEQRGFVEPVRNKGFRVTEVSEQGLREIVELRQMLEAPAMRALAGRFPVETLPRWRALAAEVAARAKRGRSHRLHRIRSRLPHRPAHPVRQRPLGQPRCRVAVANQDGEPGADDRQAANSPRRLASTM